MNQQLEHGMKVRLEQDIYNVFTGEVIWRSGQTYTVTIGSNGLVFVCGAVAWGNEYHDYTSCFEIIPEPMTEEEAMEKILQVGTTVGNYGVICRIIDEYKKGRDGLNKEAGE